VRTDTGAEPAPGPAADLAEPADVTDPEPDPEAEVEGEPAAGDDP
jgi:hypothetical protein